MADIPDMPALVEVLKREFGVRDHFARAILTAVLPLVVGPVADTLDFYADPEVYHGVAFLFDRPGGGFEEDFDEDHGHEFYDRPMPGKMARNTLSQLKALGTGEG